MRQPAPATSRRLPHSLAPLVCGLALLLLALVRPVPVQAGPMEPVAAPRARLDLPMDLEEAKAQWNLSSDFQVVEDERLGRPVLEHQPKPNGWISSLEPIAGPCAITARVRIMTPRNYNGATLSYGAIGPVQSVRSAFTIQALASNDSPLSMRVTTSMGTANQPAYQTETQTLQDDLSRIALSNLTIRPRFPNVSPVWDPEFRKEIESVNAALKPVDQQWFTLTIIHDGNTVQMYKDGLLVGERTPVGPVSGALHLRLWNHVRIASLTVAPVTTTRGYQPVPLTSLANASAADPDAGLALAADALPAPGLARVHGVPMHFDRTLDGFDHVDVGASLFHHRNRAGQFTARETWPAVGELDGGRLRVTVPNRPYTRLWVLAASDDQPNSVPVLTARFYQPDAGFPIDAAVNVPSVSSRSAKGEAKRVTVKRADGSDARLWLVPIDLDSVRIASEMRENDVLSLELTKQVFGYRTYPDPANYSWFQGGLPSSVHVLAMTLEEAPIKLIATGNRPGNTYVLPEQPIWRVQLNNLAEKELEADVQVTITDPLDQTIVLERSVDLASGQAIELQLPVQTRTTGLHTVRTRVTLDGSPRGPKVYTQEGTLVQLPSDDRSASATNTHWGLWNWNGGHGTNPNTLDNIYLNRAAGARYMMTRDYKERRAYGIIASPQHVLYGPEAWAFEDPIDPAKYQEFSDRIGQSVAKRFTENPDIPSFSIFTETAISAPLTYGIPPEYLGEGEYQMNDDEQKRYKAFWVTAKAACEGIRKHAPKAKIALGWCEPNFTVPFLRDGFPKELFDMIGVDSPIFDRTPEMPIREVTPNRMWLLKQAMQKYGYSNVPIIHTESYYPTSHPLALGFQASADHTIRVAVLSLALESDFLANCFTLHDTSSYWGSQHYGCIGLIGRRPEYNPKPAFPAFATMTRMIDLEQFDGFIPTGSDSAYCVRFKYRDDLTYALWTIHGTREAQLTFPTGAAPRVVYATGREEPLTLRNQVGTVSLDQSVLWVRTTASAAIESITLGEPTYTAQPGHLARLAKPHVLPLDDLYQPWQHSSEAYPEYDQGHWGAPRYPGPMKVETVTSSLRKQPVWKISLQKPAVERPLAAWYTVLTPPKPIAIPGRAKALGIWAHGRSNWGRIVYEITDAKGEVWRSIGARDDWNCDDPQTWSYFDFDGWRYLEFPLPNHEPGDNYRDMDTTWWSFDAEGVVDLPVQLTRVMVELRTHNIYVDQLLELPEAQRSVELANLVAVYPNPAAATAAPVQLQRAAASVLQFEGLDRSSLPNPWVELQKREVAPAAPKLVKLAPPEHQYDGTRLELTVEPVEGAKEYRVYVSAYDDGAGAQVLAKGAKETLLVRGLRPEFPLYLFATYVDAKGNESLPTALQRVLLKDDFPMK